MPRIYLRTVHLKMKEKNGELLFSILASSHWISGDVVSNQPSFARRALLGMSGSENRDHTKPDPHQT
jgi:hypothetical protein